LDLPCAIELVDKAGTGRRDVAVVWAGDAFLTAIAFKDVGECHDRRGDKKKKGEGGGLHVDVFFGLKCLRIGIV
jgi:hypothetical protein